MKKSLTIFLISLLFSSIIAFGFILADNSTTANNATNTFNSTNGSTIVPPNPAFRGETNEDKQEREVKTKVAFSQELSCRLNFNIGVLSAMMSAVPNSTSVIQPILNTLQNDLLQIQSLNNSTDVKYFAKNQMGRDMRSAIASVPTRELRGISLDARAQLVSAYKQLAANYSQCEQKTYMNITQERVNEYQVQIANFQDKANKLATKGFNTTSLNQLLQDAQNQIVVPLQNAVGNATTAQDVQTAVRSYCLFNGCTNGTNFHLDAKFDIARLSIVLADLQKNAAAFNLSSDSLAQAQQYLTDAQTILNNVGTSVYQEKQAQQIFSGIQKAAKIIIQLMTQALKQPIGVPLK